MTLLIITLPLEPADTAVLLDCVQSPEGTLLTSHVNAPLALLPSTNASVEVVAVVPAQALSWHQVRLPQGSLPRSRLANRSTHRLRTILVGLLEDRLLDEPAQLHLALQPQATVDAPVWVAACNRTWLSAALGVLAQAGYNVARIVPETTPQSLADAIEVTEGADQPMVAGRVAKTAAGDDDAHAGLLVCPLSATSVALLSGDIPVLAEPAVASLAEQLFQRPVTLQQRGQRLLGATHTPWDLAQFEFAYTQRHPRWAYLAQSAKRFVDAPEWRAARWALVLLMLGNLIGLNTWAMREQASLRDQKQAVRAVLTDTFPKVPVVVDAPVQMARELAVLQRASGGAAGTDMESMLSAFSTLAPVGYVPLEIQYAANDLRLVGPPMSSSEQDQIARGLKELGWVASVQGDTWHIQPGSGVGL